MAVSIDPVVLSLLALAEGLYLQAILTLARRGRRISRWQIAAWHAGLALNAVALIGPLDPLGEDLLSAHMAQHVLIADLAAPLLIAGLRTPVLVFFLPRPMLVTLARRHGLRRVLRTLRRPLVAVPVYVLVLYSWHLPFMFEGALRSPVVHVLQHESFVLASILLWWSALEPQRARMPGALWKIGYITGARLFAIFLGMAFVVMRAPAYGGFYGDRAREHGLTPLADQQVAGGIMMSVDALLVVFALALFFWRASSDATADDRREREARLAAAAEPAAGEAGPEADADEAPRDAPPQGAGDSRALAASAERTDGAT